MGCTIGKKNAIKFQDPTLRDPSITPNSLVGITVMQFCIFR
jgi:hypothetical protein